MKRHAFINLALVFSLVLGLALTGINLYGLFQDIRPGNISNDDLRFSNDFSIPYEESLRLIEKEEGESAQEYAERLTRVVAQSLAHIHWTRYDSRRFNQLVPVWENYILYFMGRFSGIPEFERYHFADYRRSLKRGIGICGDASMVMSEILEQQGIDNRIISFPGHVVTSVQTDNGSAVTYDPDFGVVIPYSIDEINRNPRIIAEYYRRQGYSPYDIAVLETVYKDGFQRWEGVEDFIRKKYYFERVAYALKWPLPLLLIAVPAWFLFFRKRNRGASSAAR